MHTNQYAENTMLTAKLVRQYKKENKRGAMIDMFVYHVSGTQPELDKYKEVQGDFYRVDELAGNKPCWFSTEYYGQKCNLVITQPKEGKEPRVIADTSKTAQMNSLIRQFPGAIGKAIAENIAKQLLESDAPDAPEGMHDTDPDPSTVDSDLNKS